jgi:hypothetical protein
MSIAVGAWWTRTRAPSWRWRGRVRPEHFGVADQDDLGVGEGERRVPRALHDLFGGVIASHRVDDDALHGAHLAT